MIKATCERVKRRWQRHTARLRIAWDWFTWLLLSVLLFIQVIAIVYPIFEVKFHVIYGQEPSLGENTILGENDDPFTDRAIVCKRDGRQYVPVQLSQALLTQRSQPVSTTNMTTNGIDAYRVIPRQSIRFDAGLVDHYVRSCSFLALKMDRVLDICTRHGYSNVTRDVLRVIDGTDDDSVTILPETLPVLLLPYWDLGSTMRLAVPSTDGSACVFRLGSGEVSMAGRDLTSTMTITPRHNREVKTVEWLGSKRGQWRNGWYEDATDGSRWYSDVLSADPSKPYDLPWFDFDLDSEETPIPGLLCAQGPSLCEIRVAPSRWGSQLEVKFTLYDTTSLIISDGSRRGLFLYETSGIQLVQSFYSLEKFIANTTLAGLLFQWMVAMLALNKRQETIGVGALANALSFKLLPLTLLPRLRSTLEGFWTVGCQFEGDQIALSESWSTIYPAIGEFVIVYFSLLNTIAKLARRRMSDALFGPTLLFFAVLHFFRFEIATAKIFGVDGRISTVVTSEDVETASLATYLTTDLAFRVNGRIVGLFAIKLTVLALNLIPLVVGASRERVASVAPMRVVGKASEKTSVEVALAMEFASNGGLGLSAVYMPHPSAGASSRIVVLPYELARAGLVVVGSSSVEALVS